MLQSGKDWRPDASPALLRKLRDKFLAGLHAFLALLAVGVFCETAVAQVQVNLLGPSGAAPISSTIQVYPNTMNKNYVAGAQERVTIGVPFSACTLTDAKNFRLLDEKDAEVAVFVKPTLHWRQSRQPCLQTSIRALKVQFAYDATQGSKTYRWELTGRNTANDLTETPVAEIPVDLTIKGTVKEPRVFGFLPPAYLVTTGIVSPTVPLTHEAYDAAYYPIFWKRVSADFDYTKSIASDWLFDRVTANYTQALRSAEPAYYREAYLSHEWYISKLEVTGTNNTVIDYCLGGFNYDGKAKTFSSGGSGCDTKYIYVEPYKLHLALTGDDSWTPQENGTPSASGFMDSREEVWTTIAHLLVVGDVRGTVVANQPAIPPDGFIKAYDSLSDIVTERDLGFGLQAVLNACELSLDELVCSWADTIVDNLRQMQINNPDGIQHYGYLSHSLRQHEGEFLPWVGTLTRAHTAESTITIKDVFGDDYLKLTTGKWVRVGTADHKLAANAVNNGNGTWTLTFQTQVTAAANARVTAVYLSDKQTIDLDHATDRIFSPWMQSIVADAVWQYYNWVDDAARKTTAAAMLSGFGRAYAAYAFDGTRITPSSRSLIEAAFNDFGPLTIFNTSITAVSCTAGTTMYPRYFANKLMGTKDMNKPYGTFLFEVGGFADQHIPEGIFQLSLGLLFETDPMKRLAMQSALGDLRDWFDVYSCSANLRSAPPRMYNWGNKADPFGTYAYVQSQQVAVVPGLALQNLLSGVVAQAISVTSNKSTTSARFRLGATGDLGLTIGSKFTAGSTVQVGGQVEPQADDVGNAGEIFVVLSLTTTTGTTWSYRNLAGDFLPWNNQIATLEPAYFDTALNRGDSYTLFDGKVAAGTYRFYIGYQRKGSAVLHYTGSAKVLEIQQ